jgi:long-chain acyl-CoA synthetase
MANSALILDHVYAHEAQRANEVFMTQPLGGGPVADITWKQAVDEARRMAAHLRSRGYEPGTRIAMLSKNCAHFIIAELAVWMAGYTTVAIFPTETAETISYVLDHSGSALLFVGKLDLWDSQAPGVPASMPRIALPLAPADSGERWDDIVKRTPPLEGQPQRKADELAMLLYTSGSTGTPKGVMTSFGALSRAANGVVADLRNRIGPDEPARVLSYLPLAHSYERTWVEAASLVDGKTRVFFAESLDTFVEDLKRARPTHFLSVPRLWLKFQQGVFAKMPPAKLDRLLGIPILGGIVRKKVLKGLGLDCVRIAGSGSAPIPPDLIKWYRKLGLNLLEGYGMSEDNSFSHASTAEFNAPGCVGVPMPGVEVKLSDEGEILIKSPGQFSGYWRDPELTQRSFTEDGFFRTGDLGERTANGVLRITGRVKDIFKTTKGEYVAPVPIENQINAHPLVELSIVSGSNQAQPHAIVVLAEHIRPRMQDAAARKEVDQQLAALRAALNAKLPSYQQLHTIVVAKDPWTVENGCLTPTMKIKRARIEAQVAPQVAQWYEQKAPVLWS